MRTRPNCSDVHLGDSWPQALPPFLAPHNRGEQLQPDRSRSSRSFSGYEGSIHNPSRRFLVNSAVLVRIVSRPIRSTTEVRPIVPMGYPSVNGFSSTPWIGRPLLEIAARVVKRRTEGTGGP